jgi:hypothetical protein
MRLCGEGRVVVKVKRRVEMTVRWVGIDVGGPD